MSSGGKRRRWIWRYPPGAPRRRGRLTREGNAFVFVTVGVGAAAVNTGNNLLYLMLGLMLSLLLLSMVLSENALRNVRVVRQLPRRAFAGAPCLVTLTLHNDKRLLPSYSLEVEDRAENVPTDRRCFFLKVGGEGSQTASYRRTPPRRGVLRLTGYQIGTRYPFGLVEKGRIYQAVDELLVYPALVPIDPSELGGLREGADRPTPRTGPGTEIVGLRDYRAGDPARFIHWRRTASLGRIVVRERERDAAARISIVLDNERPDGGEEGWDDAFEHAISRAASLAAAFLARGASVDIVTRGATSPLVHGGGAPDPIWAFLARLGPARRAGRAPIARAGGDVREVAVSAAGPRDVKGAA